VIVKNLLTQVPIILASKTAILFLVALFAYLVVLGVIGLFYPDLEPSATIQLVLGNYTNVTSALGASIAAGASVTVAVEVKDHVKKVRDAEHKQHLFREQFRKLHGIPHPDDA
jgi:hypothetical protein